MKKIMITGLGSDVTEESIRESLERVGPVSAVEIIRDGDPERPVVVVTMDIDDPTAYAITSRVTEYWHEGHMLNARLLLH
jgi:fructose 1,6-bisphosphatase